MEARCEAVRKREWRARRRRELRQVCAACDAIFNPRRADAEVLRGRLPSKGPSAKKGGRRNGHHASHRSPVARLGPCQAPITRIEPEAAQRPVLRGPNGRIIDVASLIR
jgi:hypothetical protein